VNVIVIMLDSLRVDHVGCYGNDWIRTPALDGLAREGVRFTRAFPEALPTLPVRRAMHTGMRTFPDRGFVPRKGDNVKLRGWGPIPEDRVAMAEVFRREGYLTALFCSVLHMFKPSMNFHRGFDCWEWIRGQEADRYRAPLRKEIEDPRNLPCELAYGCVGHSMERCLANMRGWRTEEDWFPPRTFGAAIEWLEENRDVEKFLLVVDEFDPHEPWNAPKNFLDLYFDTAKYKGRRVINTRAGPYPFREGELEYTRAQYAGEVTLVDKYVGRLLDRVKELGLWGNTAILLLSDHGHPIMDHGVIHKLPQYLYPELMDLVFILRHPDKDHAGETCDAYVSTHDVPPTLYALAGLTPPVPLDGRNVWEWVTGESEDRRDYMTSIYGDTVWCRDEEHAYIADLEGNRAKLYDVQEDPKQMNNIADQKPQACRKMHQRVLKDAGGPIPPFTARRRDRPWYDATWI